MVNEETNPSYPYALRIKDVAKGVNYLEFSTMTGMTGKGTFSSSVSKFNDHYQAKGNNVINAKTVDETGTLQLANMGIAPYRSGDWNTFHFAIIDTAKRRKQLVFWLQQNDISSKERIIGALKKAYPDDFKPLCLCDLENFCKANKAKYEQVDSTTWIITKC